MPFFSDLSDKQLEFVMIALLAFFQWGIAFVAQKLLNIANIKEVGHTRFGVISISIIVELYFKFSLLADDTVNSRRPTDILFYSLCATIGVFIVFLLFERNIYAHEKRAEMQLEQVQMQYEMQNARRYLRANADIRRLYHDMKNHLLALESMIKSGGEPEQYITELRSRLESYDVNVNTGNAVADTLLAEKIERARLDNISFNVCADLSMFSFMNSVDMVTILANAIDNAVEALIQLPEGQEPDSVHQNYPLRQHGRSAHKQPVFRQARFARRRASHRARPTRHARDRSQQYTKGRQTLRRQRRDAV